MTPTLAQQELAKKIADAGMWKYSKVIELMEKKSPLVNFLKAGLNIPANSSYKVAGKLVSAQDRAYANARLAEELGASQFAQAYVFYLNGSTPEVAKSVTDVSAKIKAVREKRPEMTAEWIQAKLAQYLEEREAYMSARIAKCQE
jgi:hypothetical protein